MTIENLIEFEKKRIQPVEGMNSKVIRGISDAEATELIRNFAEYAVKFPKLKEGIGMSYAHAIKHASEFDSTEAFNKAMNSALSSSLELTSRDTKLYLKNLDNEAKNFMLAFTMNDPILNKEVMLTGYSAIAQPGEKDITKVFESLAENRNIKMFRTPAGEAKDSILELYSNKDLAIIVNYNLKDSKCLINADKLYMNNWESTKSGLVEMSRKACERYFSQINPASKIINLNALAYIAGGYK